MIIALILILMAVLGASLHYADKLSNSYCFGCNRERDSVSGKRSLAAIKSFYCCFIVYITIVAFFYAIVASISYVSYVDCRTFLDATMEQYEGAITLYEKHGVINLSKAAKMALTDNKYEGYQENMAQFIYDLRRAVTKYNEAVVSKRVMGDNPFFSWFIVEPDGDMKILKICKD